MQAIEFLNAVTTGLGFWGGIIFGAVAMCFLQPHLVNYYNRHTKGGVPTT